MGEVIKRMKLLTLSCMFLLLSDSSLANVSGTGGEFRIGVPQHLPGLEVVNGEFFYNSVMAWYVEIHQCVTEQTDNSFSYHTLPTPRLIKMARKGELDALFPLGFDHIRDQHLIRSVSLSDVKDYFIYLDTPSSFTDKFLIVAARLGTPQANYLKEKGYANTVLLEDYERFGELLELGRIDMAAIPHIALDKIIDSLSPDLRLLMHVYTTRGVGYYFSPHLTESRRAAINRKITSCVASFPEPASYNNPR